MPLTGSKIDTPMQIKSDRHRRRTLGGFLALIMGCVVLGSGARAAGSIVIRHVNVITMVSPQVLRDRTVVVRDGVIASIGGNGLQPSREATVVDGRGRYLMPGLCDMHVHIGDDSVRTAPESGIAEAIQRTRAELLVYLRAGVTCVRNMSGSPFHLELRRKLESGAVLGPRFVTTSPIVDGERPVWPFAIKLTTPEGARDLVQSLKASGYDTIKIYNGLTRNTYAAIIVAAREAGIKVVGHVPFDVGIWGALAMGQYSLEHFRGYDFDPNMPPSTSGASNRFAWWFSLTDEDLQRLARATADAGVYNCPTLNLMELAVKGEGRAKLSQRPALEDLPPAMRAAVMNDLALNMFSDEALKAMRDSLPVQQRLLRYMLNVGAPILAGTDTPALGAIAGDSLHRELELIAEAAGDTFAALRTATIVPAEYFGNSAKHGTVEVGKEGELVLLEANPLESVSNVRNVAGVVIRGQWLSVGDLKARLAQVSAQ